MTQEDARQVLRENGFFVDNLWHISDVMQDYECTKHEAYDILSFVLHNSYTIEKVFDLIAITADDAGLKKKYTIVDNDNK